MFPILRQKNLGVVVIVGDGQSASVHRQLLYTTISVTVSAQRTVTRKATLLLSALCVGNILPLMNNQGSKRIGLRMTMVPVAI